MDRFSLSASIGSAQDAVVLALVLAVLAAAGAIVLRRSDRSERVTAGLTEPDQEVDDDEEETATEPADDYEVVQSILADHGGRTRQSTIVNETGWSKAKVSAVLGEMAEDGAVSKLRVGRENIVSLPGHEPDAVDSAFED